MRTLVGVAVGCLALAAGRAAPQPSAPPQAHVRGDVVAVSGDTLQVQLRSGAAATLRVPDGVRIAVASPSDLASVRQGAYVGATAVRQGDGTLRAVELHVFPDSMRGVGEGHRPWDLQPGSTMTNATVASERSSAGGAAQSSMTNATVAEASPAAGGRKLTLTYTGGEKTLLVPAGTPVVKLAPGTRAELVPGAHLFALASRQRDGVLLAERITVGQGGLVPPM